MVVATETSVFFIDGGFTKKSTLFWEVGDAHTYIYNFYFCVAFMLFFF